MLEWASSMKHHGSLPLLICAPLNWVYIKSSSIQYAAVLSKNICWRWSFAAWLKNGLRKISSWPNISLARERLPAYPIAHWGETPVKRFVGFILAQYGFDNMYMRIVYLSWLFFVWHFTLLKYSKS